MSLPSPSTVSAVSLVVIASDSVSFVVVLTSRKEKIPYPLSVVTEDGSSLVEGIKMRANVGAGDGRVRNSSRYLALP